MAARALARRAPSRIVVRMPSGAGSRIRRYARAGVSAAARAAATERHTMVALGAAGIHGYMTRPGSAPLPHVEQLGTAGTYGAIAWAIGKFTGSTMAQHAATGLLAVQVDRWTSRAPAAAPAAPGAPDASRGLGHMAGTL